MDIQTPILAILKKRASYLDQPDGYGWVVNDPVVGCFAPALYTLAVSGTIQLDKQTYQDCYTIYWQHGSFWVKREQQLKEILKKFEEAAIEVIPLKGAALLETLYKRIGLRPMGDIDILVRYADFLIAAEILLSCGMLPKWQAESQDLLDFQHLPKKYWPGALGFHHDAGLHIDLHKDLVSYHWYKIAYPFEMAAVWERRETTLTEGAEDTTEIKPLWINRLSQKDMLAHLCVHLASHGLRGMKQFLDVDLFIRALPEDWDWEGFTRIAREWQICSCTYHVFNFCKTFFDTPIPQKVYEQLKPTWFLRFQLKLLIKPDTILKNKKTFGMHYPTLVKFSLLDSFKIKSKTLYRLLLPGQKFITGNTENRGLLGHWMHILKVVFRGD